MSVTRQLKRIGTDLLGYLLILAAFATGWLPGPGGIPLAVAGLGLLSIHNKWAKELREYVLENGGKFMRIVFPRNPIAQWAYDLIAVTLLAVAFYLGWQRAAYWQVALAASAFFLAVFIALMNRERLDRIRGRNTK